MAKSKDKFLPFEEARRFAQSLKLENQKDWRLWTKSPNRPLDIPTNPERTYKENWSSWGDWLGTGTIHTGNVNYIPFDQAREFVRKLKLKSTAEYKDWAKSANRRLDIPTNPQRTYKENWLGMGDWLGTGKLANSSHVYLRFEDAREFVRSLNIKSEDEWRLWTKSAYRPLDIPTNPQRTYKENWLGMGDWLGTGNTKSGSVAYRAFEDAREYARSLNLSGKDDWLSYKDIPRDIPKAPHLVYEEWINWGDWVGSFNIGTHDREYLQFHDAREFVQRLKFRNQGEFFSWSKSPHKPKNIPAAPHYVYKTSWISWGDWLGNDSIAPIYREFRSFKEARNYVRSLNLENQKDYQEWAISDKRPQDIPAAPARSYKDEWISWGDWLGFYSAWTKTALIGFIKSLYPILPHLDPSELYSILRNNNCLNAIEQLGEDSPLKRLINNTLHGDIEGIEQTFAEIDKIDTSVSDDEILADTPISEYEITEEIIPTELDTEELPKLSPTQTLDNLDHLENILGISDEETVEFLINKALGRLWGRVLRSSTPNDEIESIRAHAGATYSTQVRDRYLEQYSGATSLAIPAGYAFKKNNELIKPNLMQRLVAYRLLTEHRIGNWSGTGAGKTLGAILGSRVIDAKLTIIIGLNNTILDEKSGWASEIKNAFPNSNILIKEKRGVVYSEIQPNYLLLNYETFQLSDSRAIVDEILDKHKVDLIVLDEVHSAKSRNQIESKRRTLINYLLLKASEANPDLRVLGMSATPVVNSLDEAVSLIELIKGREYNELDTAPKLSNALAIHEQLVINGIRYVPNYAIELKETPIEIVDNSITSELQSIGKGQVLHIEIALLKSKLKTIIDLCKSGTIIYSIFVDEIFDIIANAVKASGLRVARFNGDDKTGIELFKQGKVDVLIGSSALGTGVDGLQYFFALDKCGLRAVVGQNL
jgi:hypothetical protein